MSAVMPTLDPALWQDLVGVPYLPCGRDPGVGLDCFGLVLAVQRRMGHPVPDPVPTYEGPLDGDGRSLFLLHASDAWEEVRPGEEAPGDGVLLRLGGSPVPNHAGVLVGPGRILHVHRGSAGAAVTRIVPGSVDRFLRPRTEPAESRPGGDGLAQPAARDGVVTVRVLEDLFRPGARKTILAPWDGSSIVGYFPHGVEEAGPDLVVVLNGRRIPPAEWDSICPAPGADLILARAPGIGAAIAGGLGLTTVVSAAGPLAAPVLTTFGVIVAVAIDLAIGIGLSLVASLLMAPPSLPRNEDSEGSPTYDFAGVRNTYRSGGVIPVVYGRHKVGGQVLQQFYRVNAEGKSTLYTLLGLSHGECAAISGLGVVNELDGAQAPDSITVNGNPIKNYRGVKISTRLGTFDQESIPGFRSVVVAVGFGVILQWRGTDPPFSHAFRHVTTTKVDAFEINLFFPEGLIDYTSSGQPGTRTIHYAVRWRRKGTTAWTTTPTLILNGNTRAQFSTAFRQDGLVADRYEIEVERILPVWPEVGPDKASMMVVQSINEIASDDVAYAGIALLAIVQQATDQLSGALPNYASVLDGRLVYVWDGVSTTSPTYSRVWTQNPAWISFDILTNPYFGGGQFFNGNNADLPTCKAAADFFDSLAPDGRGNQHARGRTNIVFDKPIRLWDAASQVLSPFRGGILMIGRKIKWRIEQATSYSQLFTAGNVSAGSWELSYRSPALRANVVQVQFVNEETGYEPDSIERIDQAALDAGNAVRKTQVFLHGVTHPGRAATAAQFLLNTERDIGETLSFEAAVDAVAVEPGDVIAFAHDGALVGNVSGRLLDGSIDKVSLDRAVTLVGSDRILIRTHGTGVDVFQERTIATPGAGTYPKHTQLTVTPDWNSGDVAARGNPFALGVSGSVTRQYRVISASLTQGLLRRLSCVEYAPSIYSDDPGTVETFTDELPWTTRIPAPPTGLTLVERQVSLGDGSSGSVVDVYFTPDRSEECDVYLRRATLA